MDCFVGASKWAAIAWSYSLFFFSLSSGMRPGMLGREESGLVRTSGEVLVWDGIGWGWDEMEILWIFFSGGEPNLELHARTLKWDERDGGRGAYPGVD